MSEETGIQWTHHTFNPWWGCQRVSPGCENCYAERDAKRYGFNVWGPEKTTDRRFFGDKHWHEPVKWNAKAVAAGVRRRVFCASMADVFEDRRDLDESRERLFVLIENTPQLDWLLLTKRPRNSVRLATRWTGGWPANVWAGTTCEDQDHLEERLPHVMAIPARVRFISHEPGLGPLRFPEGVLGCVGHLAETFGNPLVHWVITGGESGHGVRDFKVQWARSIVTQCRMYGASAFVKQLGARAIDFNDGRFAPTAMEDEEPGAWPDGTEVEENPNGFREEYQGAPVRIRLKARKGGDMEEWPLDLRVREFPA